MPGLRSYWRCVTKILRSKIHNIRCHNIDHGVFLFVVYLKYYNHWQWVPLNPLLSHINYGRNVYKKEVSLNKVNSYLIQLRYATGGVFQALSIKLFVYCIQRVYIIPGFAFEKRIVAIRN